MATKTAKPAVDTSLFAKASAGGYLPAEQAAWVEFRANDAPADSPPVRVKINVGMTNAQIEHLRALPATSPMADVWERIAPFVLGWNIQHRAEDGQVYDVLPPAEVGPEAFKYLPVGLFWQINNAIVNVPYRRLDPKSSAGSAPGGGSTPDNA